MKEYDLKITKENIEESIRNDILKRNSKLNKLIELLNSIEENKIIAIDGKWGCGKTFFLKQLEYINKEDCKSDVLKNSGKFEGENIKKFKEKYDVYYYNAWENDMHNIPLLSLIYNLINDHQNIRKRTASGEIELPINIRNALNTISKGIIDIDKVKSYEDLVKEITTAEEKKKALNNIINDILQDNKKLIFIIDELDRCNPKYAVDMIEVIKHFYTNDKIVFLLGINNEQLSHTISNYYGVKFDSYGYLNKIYNLIIELDEILPSTYIESVIGIKESSRWSISAIFAVCNYFNFQMREINRIMNDFDIIMHYISTSGYSYSENNILKNIFLPYSLGLKIKGKIELTNFLTGNGYEELEKFVFSNEKMKKIIEYSIKSNINSNEKKEIVESEIKEYLKKEYISYFYEKSDDWEIKETKKIFLDTFSLLGNFSRY